MKKCKCGHRLPPTDHYPLHCSCGRIYHGPNRGLGDVVAKAVKLVTREKVKPCVPCQKRQEKLNRWWPFRKK